MRDASIVRRDYILMEHLQVVEGGRQQWHIQRDGEGGYIFQAVSRDPAKARATVNDLLRASNLPFHAEGDAATACLHVPASQVRAFAAAMMRVSGVTTSRRARSCCSSSASCFGTLISTSAGAAGSGLRLS